MDLPFRAWLDRCALELGRQWPALPADDAIDIARELWTPGMGDIEPEQAASFLERAAKPGIIDGLFASRPVAIGARAAPVISTSR